MSGSSYSRSSYSGAGFGEENVPSCDKINILTQVVSPTMSYFGIASVGDFLHIELDQDDVVVLVNSENDEVGSVNPPEISTLIKCLKEGNKYNAIIKSIDGAHILVNISVLSE